MASHTTCSSQRLILSAYVLRSHHQSLSIWDPCCASRFHPNNRRAVESGFCPIQFYLMPWFWQILPRGIGYRLLRENFAVCGGWEFLRCSCFRYVFTQDIMQVISSDPLTKPYSRVCIQAYDNHKFLVAHEESGQTRAKYTCMQFVQRSETVFQIKEGELSDRMGRTLCSDNNLKLDGWVIMDMKNVMEGRVDCALVGGFSIQVYDKSMNKGVCDGYLGETRLESECLPGEGLNFYFRQAKCVADGLYMYPEQRTYCLANWDEGNFKFILLKHNRMNYLWVLRYDKYIANNGRFSGLLMKDLYASADNAIPTNNYLSLSMSVQSPKTLNSMCYDDYEICSVLSDPCSYSDEIARTCAKTCGFCTDLSPSVCKFSVSINGSWVDGKHADGASNVLVNTTAIHIAGQETLYCVKWPGSSRPSRATDREDPTADAPTHEEKKAYEQMLVTVSDNGCRPRFSCGKFTRLPSNVMFMHLSQTRLWPLVENKQDPYDCKKFSYTSDKDVDTNPYRTRHENLVVLNHINSNVKCDLSQFEHFAVLFRDGVRCSGEIQQDVRRTTIQLSFPECSAQRLRHRFTCLEHSPFSHDGDKLLVTKSHEASPKVHCWLFPRRPNNVFHIVESEQCNTLMKRRLRKGRLRPVATFTRDPTRQTDTVGTISPDDAEIVLNETVAVQPTLTSAVDNSPAETTTKSTARNTNRNSSREKDNANNRVRTTPERNLTVIKSDAENSGTKSPVVVAAVVVTLIVMQIPLICKCKCWEQQCCVSDHTTLEGLLTESNASGKSRTMCGVNKRATSWSCSSSYGACTLSTVRISVVHRRLARVRVHSAVTCCFSNFRRRRQKQLWDRIASGVQVSSVKLGNFLSLRFEYKRMAEM